MNAPAGNSSGQGQGPAGPYGGGGKGGKFSFKCTTCGATLPVETDKNIIVCEYCGAQNIVPASVRQQLAPRQQQAPQTASTAPSYGQEQYRQPQYATAPAARKKGSVLAFLIPLVIFLVSGGVSLFSYLGKTGKLGSGGHPEYGNAKGLVDSSAVVPSFENADPFETAANIIAMVEERWVPGGKVGQVNFNKVDAGGTIDVGEDSDGSILLYFYDMNKYESRLPGESSIKSAMLTVNVLGGYVAASTSDASLSYFEDAVFLERMPKCSIKELLKEVRKAGYPDTGYADIRFPEVASRFTDETFFEMGFQSLGSGRKRRELKEKELEVIWEKVSDEGWREKHAYSYSYSVSGFDASELPGLFGIHHCEPTDTEEFRAAIVKKYLY